MITLYGTGISFNVSRVRYCLHELGLEYEWIQTNPMKGETNTPEFQAMTPLGKIPVIDIDGFKLFESNTINRYLASVNDSSLYPKDLKARALVDAWMDFSTIHVGGMMGRVLWNRVLAPMIGKEVDEASLQTGLNYLALYYPKIEAQLVKTTYLASNDLSLADFTLLSLVDASELAQISLDKYPKLVAWRKVLQNQSFYQKCYQDFTGYVQGLMSKKES